MNHDVELFLAKAKAVDEIRIQQQWLAMRRAQPSGLGLVLAIGIMCAFGFHGLLAAALLWPVLRRL